MRFIILVCLFLLNFFIGAIPAFAYSNGSLISSNKINESTTNGPALGINSGYGWSIAGIGDLDADGVPDIAVTRTGDASGTGKGGFFIEFMNANGSIKSTVQITDTTPNGPALLTGDTYGYSIANIGDLNNDGVDDIVVGSYGNDMGGAANTNRGAIFIHYMNRDGSIISSVKIGQGTTNGPTLALNDHYGTEVANLGDLDNDGINDIAVGAGSDDTGGLDRGAIYIHYMNRDGSIKSTVKIASGTANGPTLANSDGYGKVANIGDLDADGINDIAVGTSSGTGAVFIHYMNRNGTIKSTVKIDSTTANSSVIASTGYGIRVRSLGDLDNDGIPDMIVGAYSDDTGGTDRGAVYLHYMNRNGSIKSSVKIANGTTNGPTMVNTTYYGAGLDAVGDINGDGAIDLAVGVPYDNSVKGAMYLHFLTPTPAITVSKTSLSTTEGQVGDTFTVVLNSKPTSGVTVGISIVSSEVTLSTNTLVFDSTNWNEPQLVTVTAIDDTEREAAHNDTLTFSVTSSDTNYNNMSLSSIPVTVLDNDAPGVVKSKTSLSVAEGNADTFTVVLNSQPTNDVTIALNLSTNQATIDKNSLTFTTSNWNTPQTVTFTPVNDSLAESTLSGSINFTATSTDVEYNGISIPSIAITILDNDTAGVTPSTTTLSVLEGIDSTFTVVLNTQPTNTVTVTPTTTPSNLSISPSLLTFTTSNWNVPQVVTVNVPNNATNDGVRASSISFAVVSSDSTYNAFSVTSIPVSITDDDVVGITALPPSLSLTEGASGEAVTIHLTSQPTSTVSIAVALTSNQVTVNTNTLTFTTSNWSIPQTLTVTAVDDSLVERNQTDTIRYTVSSSDPSYNAFALASTLVTISDNEVFIGISRGSGSFPRKILGQPAKEQPIASIVNTPAGIRLITKQLSTGSKDDQVKILQKFLNQRGFIVSSEGAGSPGKETSLFGSATKKALIDFQKTYDISPSLGVVDLKTMNTINSLSTQ